MYKNIIFKKIKYFLIRELKLIFSIFFDKYNKLYVYFTYYEGFSTVKSTYCYGSFPALAFGSTGATLAPILSTLAT